MASLCLRVALDTFLLFVLSSLTYAHSIHNHHHYHHHGEAINNVTKRLHYSVFDPNKNPSLINEIKLLGSAKLSKDMSSIQIPDASPAFDLRNQAGRAIYSSPIRLFDPLTETPASFKTTFSFQFNTTATTSATNVSVSGGGLAFVIVPDEFTVGRPGPWLGMLNDACEKNYMFAIELDASHDMEFGDPDDNHVGVDLGSAVSLKTAYASDFGVSFSDGKIYRAWITYDGDHKWLEVHLGSDGEAFPSKPIISMPLDLSHFLKEYMFVGFTASTGEMAQSHNILSWNFSSTVQAILRAPPKKTCQKNIALQVLKYSRVPHTKPLSGFMIFLAVTLLCMLSWASLHYNSKRGRDPLAFLIPEMKKRPLPPFRARSFSVPEVHRATRCFSQVHSLASDSRGNLYKGTLENGCEVTMKRFSIQFLASSGVDHKQVLTGVRAMTRVPHPSLVPIRGWCCTYRETIVVYDYFHNGSLDSWLCGLGVLPWTWRFKIIKEVADALCFLHSKGVAHGNLKTNSVFIDSSYRAALGDYGLMKSANTKADVFDFGMLILEIISGRIRSSEDVAADQMGGGGLLGFARTRYERGEKVGILDQRMASSCNLELALKVLEIGLSCSLNGNEGQPSMAEVVQFLSESRATYLVPSTHQWISALTLN